MAKQIETNIKVHGANNGLQKKFGGAGALQNIFTPERIAKGQGKIETFKESYFDDEFKNLPEIQAAAKGEVTNIDALREGAKALKGQTESLGFGFIMKVSDSLYKYLGEKTTLDKNDLLVIQKHAEAILAGIEKRERGWGGMVESELLATIELLVKKFSA